MTFNLPTTQKNYLILNKRVIRKPKRMGSPETKKLFHYSTFQYGSWSMAEFLSRNLATWTFPLALLKDVNCTCDSEGRTSPIRCLQTMLAHCGSWQLLIDHSRNKNENHTKKKWFLFFSYYYYCCDQAYGTVSWRPWEDRFSDFRTVLGGFICLCKIFV